VFCFWLGASQQRAVLDTLTSSWQQMLQYIVHFVEVIMTQFLLQYSPDCFDVLMSTLIDLCNNTTVVLLGHQQRAKDTETALHTMLFTNNQMNTKVWNIENCSFQCRCKTDYLREQVLKQLQDDHITIFQLSKRNNN
jgi:hypothetical protein